MRTFQLNNLWYLITWTPLFFSSFYKSNSPAPMFARVKSCGDDVACWKASLPPCSRAFFVGLGFEFVILPLLGGWPERVLLLDDGVDPPTDEGPASADSFVLVRLRCRTGGVIPPPISAEVVVGEMIFGVLPGVAAGVGGCCETDRGVGTLGLLRS